MRNVEMGKERWRNLYRADGRTLRRYRYSLLCRCRTLVEIYQRSSGTSDAESVSAGADSG